MLKKSILFLACLLLLLPALSACTLAGEDLMAGVKAAKWPEETDLPQSGFLESAGSFSWSLFQESISSPGNILISPASVYLALAMTINGSDKETRTAMQEALFAQKLTLAELNEGSRDWMVLLLDKNRQKKQLSLANSLWLASTFTANPAFLQSNDDYFAAAARSLDFQQDSAKAQINRWVKQNTGGKINQIVDEIDPYSVMFLINAVYFKADWEKPFKREQTGPGLFAAPAGTSQVQYMNQMASLAYFRSQDCQGVLLPYESGDFAFLAILPDAAITARQWVSKTSARDLADLLDQAKPQSISLSLPRFKSRHEERLNDALASLGMAVAFIPDQADFSLMSQDGTDQLFISEVKQKAYLEVDEKGTEAAAVTSVEMRATSMPLADLNLQFDRPFIYGIIDTRTGLPLFLGLMEDPSAG